jgi:selenocysteine lyase/cysteine desulfurase
VGPWVRLAKELNLTIKYWKPTQLPGSDSPFAVGLHPSELEPLLSANTRLIAFTATSNILGHRTPVKEVIDLVKEKTGGRCMTVVDCVAYCAHGRMNMQEWGCDAVLFSFYKVCFCFQFHTSEMYMIHAHQYYTALWTTHFLSRSFALVSARW